MHQDQINNNMISKSLGLEEQKDGSPNAKMREDSIINLGCKMEEPDSYDRLFLEADNKGSDFDDFDDFGNTF